MHRKDLALPGYRGLPALISFPIKTYQSLSDQGLTQTGGESQEENFRRKAAVIRLEDSGFFVRYCYGLLFAVKHFFVQ